MGARVTEALTKVPIVRSVAQRVGRAELTAAGDTNGTHQSEFEVDLKPLSGGAGLTAKSDLLKPLANFAGANVSANTFLAERINETLSGHTAPVAVNVYGNDLKLIDDTAQKVAAVLRSIHGAASVQLQSPLGFPQLTIRLRRSALERWGFDPVQVLDVVRTAYQGDVVGQTYEGERIFDVVVRLAPKGAGSIAHVADLPLQAPDGSYVPLGQLASIQASSGLYVIRRQGGRRLQAVTLDVEGRDFASFVRDARREIAAKVTLPTSTYIEFSGAAEGQEEAQRDLVLKALFAGVGIVVLLSIVTRNWRNLLLIMANLPFTLVGGVVAAFLAGGVLSLGSLVGFVTLFGITLRNSMMMISHYEHLVQVDGRPWDLDTAVLGAADRLAAVLMTSLVTGLALLPLAIGMNAPGREIEGPMALVILGGLVTSAALNLLVLPTLALRYGRFAAAGAGDEHAESELTGAPDRASPAE
jgi:Cu/Ag efflux pump CusA